MSSTLYVDNLIEKTSGNGVHIPGHVIQVVNSGIATDAFSFSGDNSNLFSATITPKFASSKILILVSITSERITSNLNGYYYGNLGRSINSGANTFLTRIANAIGYQAPQYMRESHSNEYYDIPNTTYPIEYIFSVDINGSGTFAVKACSLTLLEIAQ